MDDTGLLLSTGVKNLDFYSGLLAAKHWSEGSCLMTWLSLLYVCSPNPVLLLAFPDPQNVWSQDNFCLTSFILPKVIWILNYFPHRFVSPVFYLYFCLHLIRKEARKFRVEADSKLWKYSWSGANYR